jgi:hypothetical protein
MFETGKENLPKSPTISLATSSDVVAPSPSRKTPIRPLTAAYQAASSDLQVLRQFISSDFNMWPV